MFDTFPDEPHLLHCVGSNKTVFAGNAWLRYPTTTQNRLRSEVLLGLIPTLLFVPCCRLNALASSAVLQRFDSDRQFSVRLEDNLQMESQKALLLVFRMRPRKPTVDPRCNI